MVEKRLSAVAVCCLMFLPVVTAAQTPNDNRLVALFADIKQSGGVSPEIQKALQGVMESIPSMAIEQVRSAIPAIAAALSAGDEQVQAIAAAACYAVIRRPDGTELLERELPAVASLFRSPSHRVGYLAGLTLSNAKGKLDPDVMSPVVAAINQRSRSAAERIPALATAVAVAPTDSAVIDAVTAFMLEPLDASTKADALTAIRTSRIDVPAIRLELISWLQDSDARVKLGTISVLTRMGPEAVDWARLELQRITERASEQNDVRGAAAKALQMLR